MEKNKYLCPDCGSEMNAVYDKPALNLICPKCGCQVATTEWEEIDNDETNYKIIIKRNIEPKLNQIKLISKITGKNFILSKNLLQNGGMVLDGFAADVLVVKNQLIEENIEFYIEPFFKY